MFGLEEDLCPVGDELFGELYRSSKQGLPVLVATVPPDTRAMLALFCYRRSHLHEMGLAIAVSCNEDDLVWSGGRAGAALFERSREGPSIVALASFTAPQPSVPRRRFFDFEPTIEPAGLVEGAEPPATSSAIGPPPSGP
jgi:hypothetical protein